MRCRNQSNGGVNLQISEFCYKKGESKCRNRDFVWRNFSHSCKGGQTPRTKKVFDAICYWGLSPRALFLLKTNRRPALTCPYSYRHRMMTIFFFCFRHGTGTGSPSRRGVRHFWRTLRHSRPFFQKCLRAGNLFFQVCRDRLYVFDSGRFSWNLFLNCDSGFAFLF